MRLQVLASLFDLLREGHGTGRRLADALEYTERSPEISEVGKATL